MTAVPPPPGNEPRNLPEDAPPRKGHGSLTAWIFGAIVAGVAFAVIAPRAAAATAVGGEIFLNLLSMLVVPLVVTSVMAGVIGMGDVRKLGRPGGWTLLYFLGTTVIAVVIGLAVTTIVRPGVAAAEAGPTDRQSKERIRDAIAEAGPTDRANKERIRDAIAKAAGVKPNAVAKTFPVLPSDEKPTAAAIAENLIRMLFTRNLIGSAAGGDLLPLIAFSIVFAAVLTTLGPRTDDLSRLVVQANDAFMAVVLLVMKVAPIGIFCLVASRFGQAASAGPDKIKELFAQTGWYMAAVTIGLAIQGGVVLPLIYWLVRRKNPFAFLAAMGESLLMAFSTSSSTATLPVTIEAAVTKAGVSRRAADFVLPLGATVNMNGTALYEAAAVLFIAQVLKADLSLGQQVIVAVTATLAAIGAAGIPEAGLVTMLIVLNAVGLPPESSALILSVDWLLDRARTVVNVFGDAVGAAVVEPSLPAE